MNEKQKEKKVLTKKNKKIVFRVRLTPPLVAGISKLDWSFIINKLSSTCYRCVPALLTLCQTKFGLIRLELWLKSEA